MESRIQEMLIFSPALWTLKEISHIYNIIYIKEHNFSLILSIFWKSKFVEQYS